MLREFVEKVLSLAEPWVKEIPNDGPVFANQVLRPVTRPAVAPTVVHSLSGFAELVTRWVERQPRPVVLPAEARESPAVTPIAAVIVESPRRVVAISDPSRPWFAVDAFVVAEPLILGKFPFSAFLGQADFVINAHTAFIVSPELTRMLELASAVTCEQTAQADDDGLSQTVVVRSGIAGRSRAPVANPYRLQPLRTFAELVQPASPFLLRFRKEEQSPQMALFAIDDPSWLLTALEEIKTFLVERLPATVPVIC